MLISYILVFSIKIIMVRDFLKVVIKENTFRFNDRFYDQVKGVAMGTRCAPPPFANLFLAVLEERALGTVFFFFFFCLSIAYAQVYIELFMHYHEMENMNSSV